MKEFSQIKLVLRPNNQITVTIGNWKKKVLTVSQSPIVSHDSVNPKKLLNLTKVYATNRVANQEMRENSLIACPPKLDIIQKKQRIKKPPFSRRNTPKSFSKVSGQRLREAGAAMDILCGGDLTQCYELCLTLPANHDLAFAALAAHTYYATNRLFKHLRDCYGDACSWFYVWEYQRRGALHLHIAVRYPDSAKLPEICEGLVKMWIRILQDIGERSNTCMFTDKSGRACTISQNWQNHHAQIRKAVGAYFSKYAGKEESKQSWYCQRFPISRFWGSSSSIKRTIKENSIEYTWDYQGATNLTESKFQEIMELIIDRVPLVSMKSYEFKVEAKYSYHARKGEDGIVRLYNHERKVYAEGERTTIYTEQKAYIVALSMFRDVIGCF